MGRKYFGFILVLITVVCVCTAGCVQTGTQVSETGVHIVLSDSGITVDGKPASSSSTAAVYVGEPIIYYASGQDSSYGEGTETDAHTAEEAAAHTVVTITQAGVYRISGTLSAGQIVVDLGGSASEDPNAVVELILDGMNVTCTVAPAVIFYNVYETESTSTAGAVVTIADGSENQVNGSYVARIYQEGTTKKLHKYDGAFYSKMSMLIQGETAGSGRLSIDAENEGLDSELHLTINGGNILITSQDDGINTNEDGVSVTTINGGYLFVNSGLGGEGDGIDSNGDLTINGGTVITLANGRSGDGGIDADGEILINGGTVIALGSRNDAAGSLSAQPFMELSYAVTKAAGSLIQITDANGTEILTFAPAKEYQSLTFSSADLQLDTIYYVYSGGTVSAATVSDGLYAKGGVVLGGVQQQYTGNSFGMMRGPGGQGFGGGMQSPQEGMIQTPPEGGMPMFSEGSEPSAEDLMQTPPDRMHGGFTRFEGVMQDSADEGSVEFVITASTHSFSGVSDSAASSLKTAVVFHVNANDRIADVSAGGTPVVSYAGATLADGTTEVSLPASDVQFTVTDVPSESYRKTALLSDGTEGLAALLPTAEGTYQLTIAVSDANAEYTGSSLWQFSISG